MEPKQRSANRRSAECVPHRLHSFLVHESSARRSAPCTPFQGLHRWFEASRRSSKAHVTTVRWLGSNVALADRVPPPQGRERGQRAPRTRHAPAAAFPVSQLAALHRCFSARCFTPLLFLVGYFCHLQCFEIACKTDAEPRRSLQRYPCNYQKDRTLCP